MQYKKNEAVRAFADEFGYTYSSAADIYDDVCAFLKKTLIAGNGLSIYGIGVFSVENRPEMERYNMKEGRNTIFPAKKVPKFTFSEALRDKVSEFNN